MPSRPKILYISTLCSEKVLNYLRNYSSIEIKQSTQKFHRLMAEGFALQVQKGQFEAFSLIPVNSNHKKRVWNIASENVCGVNYHYVPFINLPVIKDLIVFTYSFFKVISWILLNHKKDRAVLCDGLNLSISTGAILACKLTRVNVTGILTDLPQLMVTDLREKLSWKFRLYKKIIQFANLNFDKYIVLTEQLNDMVNTRSKPYIIMEGLVDIKMGLPDSTIKNDNRILMYAGGIYVKYGILKMIEAFMMLDGNELRLHIYGQGDLENEMPQFIERDRRIKYKQAIPNEEVVKNELEATLLINPRPTDDEFTKYSFPSKNMEYMVSGTPLVTTKLPGMPIEYNNYVYLFEDESIKGMANTLKILLLKPEQELIDFGLKAKRFVLENKSNVMQAKRILEFL